MRLAGSGWQPYILVQQMALIRAGIGTQTSNVADEGIVAGKRKEKNS